VADLDRGLEAQATAAFGTVVALARLADVGETRLEVPPVLQAAEVPACAVRSRDELALADRR
jgi:hypothetical protein